MLRTVLIQFYLGLTVADQVLDNCQLDTVARTAKTVARIAAVIAPTFHFTNLEAFEQEPTGAATVRGTRWPWSAVLTMRLRWPKCRRTRI